MPGNPLIDPTKDSSRGKDSEEEIRLLVPEAPSADELLGYLRSIDEARWYTNFGPLVRRLEARLEGELARNGIAPHVATVSNATIGLELALLSLGLPRGAGVLVPALTFVASACAIERAGLQPVVADVDATRWVLTPEIAREAMQNISLSAVMPVCTFGGAVDITAWDAFALETGLPVVVDAAGAYGNQAIGSEATVVFSMHATKALGAGEGGFVAARNRQRVESVRRLSNFGIDTDTGLVQVGGTNGKLSEYHAAVALAALDGWPSVAERRRTAASWYRDRLERECPSIHLQERSRKGVYTIFPVLLPEGCDAGAVAARLDAAGIRTRRWYVPLVCDHPAFAGAPRAGSLSRAVDLRSRLLGLPFHPWLTEAAIARVCGALRTALGEQ